MTFATYQQALDYLYSRLPLFQQIGSAAYKSDLSNSIALCEVLDNPQKSKVFIHVAGTNGKGSVSNLLSAVFQVHGYKTGLFTSPHLKDFRERIRVNGEMISEDAVIAFTNKMAPVFEEINPSFFEATVALAFDYFKQQETDIAIIETGLGGRLDSTNIIKPVLSIITNIGFDHMDILGDTLQKIAFEKAGVIKKNVPVVIGEYLEETKQIFSSKAKEMNADIYFVQDDNLLNKKNLNSGLKGRYQTQNLRTVAKSLQVLSKNGFTFNPTFIQNAFDSVKELTGFKGRYEIIQESNPKIIADTGHNEHGIKEVVAQLLTEKYNNLHIVLGMVKEKDHSEILKLLPKNAIYYFCKPAIPRGLDEHLLKKKASEFGLIGNAYPSVLSGLNEAKTKAQTNDLIFIGGSTFVVGEII